MRRFARVSAFAQAGFPVSRRERARGENGAADNEWA
jgi:hypothetical protein